MNFLTDSGDDVKSTFIATIGLVLVVTIVFLALSIKYDRQYEACKTAIAEKAPIEILNKVCR